MIKQSESAVVRSVLQYLRAKRKFCWRQHTTGIYRKNLERYLPVPFLMPGSPDIYVLEDGCLTAIEAKTKTGRQSPDQLAFQRAFEKAGGRYFVVRCLDDAMRIFP